MLIKGDTKIGRVGAAATAGTLKGGAQAAATDSPRW